MPANLSRPASLEFSRLGTAFAVDIPDDLLVLVVVAKSPFLQLQGGAFSTRPVSLVLACLNPPFHRLIELTPGISLDGSSEPEVARSHCMWAYGSKA
jgi:hypothetical protein